MADDRPATAHDVDGLRSEIRTLVAQVGTLVTAQADGRVAMAQLETKLVGVISSQETKFVGMIGEAKASITKAEAAAALAVEKAHTETSILGVRTMIIWGIVIFIGSGIGMMLLNKFLKN